MNEENERVKYLLQNWSHLQLAREYEKLENIIKEAREYVKQNEFYLDYKTGACIKGVMPLLEILDKGEDK